MGCFLLMLLNTVNTPADDAQVQRPHKPWQEYTEQPKAITADGVGHVPVELELQLGWSMRQVFWL
jgi:hypothetical protein